jgi:gliding motility-associated-like protein
MKKIKVYHLLTLTLLVGFNLNAQITTSTLTPTQYVQNVLLGGGVTASNITYTGLPRMIASFTAPAITNLGLGKGVYLTSGSNGLISTEQGPDGPSSLFQNTDQFQPGDVSLDGLTTTATQDASVLEFDFIPQSDTVRFRYIFGSEEYNEFVNSTFNDVFAFILSGVTTPFPATNIALIPGTTIPITINNVNNGNSFGASTGPCSNCVYYRDNDGGSIDCVYDGLTTVLIAKHKVICGEKYHIKIAVADAGDGNYDSGVFLEAGSFSSTPPLNVYTTNSNSNIPDYILVEDCNTYCAYFIRNGNVTVADSFALQVSGNAILGTDYVQNGNPTFTWPTKLYFAPNQDTIKVCNIYALQDGIIEGSDTLRFTMSSFITSTTSCLSSNAIKFNLYINDYTPISIGQNNMSICSGLSAILNAAATLGYPAYTYSLSSPSVNTATLNTGPINSVTNFTITVNDVCNKPVTKQITVTPVATPTVVSDNAVICVGDVANLTALGASTYTWNTGITNSVLTITPTVTTSYTVIGAVGTCTNSAIGTVTVNGQSISITGNNNMCIGQSSTLSANGGSAYTWNTGATGSVITVTPSTNTTYTTTSTLGSCTNTAVFTVSVAPIPTITVVGTAVCPGQSAIITASGATTYTWSTGANTNVISVNPLVNTSYTVTGTTVASCSNTSVYTVNVISSKPQLQQLDPIKFCLDSTKKIAISVSNGNPPYTLSWLIPSNGMIPYDTVNTTYYFTQTQTPSNANYIVIVTDQCLFKDTIMVNIETLNCNLSVPNVVTPNGDNINDIFKINGLENFPNSALNVFNRWGKKIYASEDYKNDWKPEQNDGTYFYVLEVSDGRKLNGFFQLFKN